MPASTSPRPRVAVLADSDTRWKWGALTAHRIAPDHRLDGFLLRGRATPTARQLDEVGVRADSLREVTTAGFLRAVTGEPYDVVVLACVGGAVQAMLHGLARATAGAGEVERGEAGPGAAANGTTPALGTVPAPGTPAPGTPAPGPAPGERPHTVCFAVQPSVPDNRAGRDYLLRRAAGHARLHPDREVLIKLRSKPGEHTTHIEELPYQKLVSRLPGGLPANCRLVYGHMGEVLDRTDLLVTVSSTAALEALHRGIPTAVLTDLGIREALGNHHFLGSGCLASWDELDAGHRPEPDRSWLARQGVAADGHYEHAFDAARERIAELLARPALPPIAPYYTTFTAPGYLPGILARYGLDVRGEPTGSGAEDDTAARGVRQVVRSAVRDAARGAYRHGVQRVAPVIRRLGEL
ncbi:DUF6716 putative glycosyltransferase [Streptomyces albus]|uniref:DUF6716 putative glycosyltransferase n=1 Tax=Streptomyces albus TaxID=1888 RepID=UPI0004C894AD|nr:DUF6716 putative glycosyltransferase [Streptomyces albus]